MVPPWYRPHRTASVDPQGDTQPLVTARVRTTSFVFTLSEPARVLIAITRRTRQGYEPVGTFAVEKALAGKNRKRFAGRLGATSLRPGLYRAELVAIDAASNRSKTKRPYFRILAP